MKILAIDPATKTGWAHSSGPSGVWDLSIKKDESSGMRLIRFEGKLREIIKTVGIDVIVFEAPTAARGPRANLDAVKLGTKLQAVIEKLVEQIPGLECKGYNLTEIKSFALGDRPTGKKRSGWNKEAIIEAAKAKWPDRVIHDDNEADALWLLELAKDDLCVEEW